MNKIKNIFLLFLNCGFFFSSTCNSGNGLSTVIFYQNIQIYADLSSRLKNSPNDSLVIEQLLWYFEKDCVRPGVKINDKSSIQFSRANFLSSSCSKASIDLGEFGHRELKQKQEFVNNTSTTRNLSDAIKEFRNNVSCCYKERDKGGLDLLSLLNSEINSGNWIKEPKQIIIGKDTTIHKYDNHLFLFTDGYLEFSKKHGNEAFYFGEKNVDELRSFCQEKSISIDSALVIRPDFKITPLRCDNNKLIKLYILETYDRGINVKKGTIENSGELSDNNILKAIWTNWAMESNFAKFEWKSITKANNLPNNYIKKLIEG